MSDPRGLRHDPGCGTANGKNGPNAATTAWMSAFPPESGLTWAPSPPVLPATLWAVIAKGTGMRRLGLALLATTALATCGAEALAGNSAVNPRYRAPAPVFNPWMGWYAGGNVGGSWGRARSDLALSGFATMIGVSDTVAPDGVIGGGQLGYNWELDSKWLVGVETDIQASGEKASGARFDTVDFEGVTTNYETKIEWFGTVRGRLGYVFDRGMLLYATGGFAYGRVSVSGTSSSIGTTAFSSANANPGWTVGAGLEGTAWDPRWTWKVEYLYLDLGSLDATVSSGLTTTHYTTRFTDHIARAGLNFHF